MEEADYPLGFPSVVSLSPFSSISTPSSRRISSYFIPNRPVAMSPARRLARVSLQGRIVNAEEASSAKSIGGGLSPEEAVAWELFSPIQRFLVVAVIGVAAAESNKNKLILQLKKSVELRDQVLSSMQQKLDNLCKQVNGFKNHSGAQPNASLDKNAETLPSDAFGCDRIKFIDCGCWHCDHHQNLFAGEMENSAVKVSKGDEVLQYKTPLVDQMEQDERRMSDLSDWASSVTSAADIQMNMSAVDQDILNLKKDCEEKDATITELTAIIQSTNMIGSKRPAELEDIIRRKNTTIMKLKKDIAVLEQKVVHLTRLRRPSSSRSSSESRQLPLMVENIVYDMDSNTSSSSSDSDSSPKNRSHGPVVAPVQHSSNNPPCSDANSDYSYFPKEQSYVVQIQETLQNTEVSPSPFLEDKSHIGVVKSQVTPFQPSSDSPACSDTNSEYSYCSEEQVHSVQIQETPVQNTGLSPRPTRKGPATARGRSSSATLSAPNLGSRVVTSHEEKSSKQKSSTVSSFRPKQLSPSADFKKIRRRIQTTEAAPKKRWT